MRIHKTYSINSEVVKEFELEVEKNQRSRVLDALIIEYLIKIAEDSRKAPSDMVYEDSLAKEEITNG